MPAGAAVNVVTGVPFSGATFNAGTSVFVVSGDYTKIFISGAIIAVFGTSTTNDGYYQVVSSMFSGGDTNVTVMSYTPGSSTHPGTTPFVSSGAGTALWVGNISGAPHYQDALPGSWTRTAGPEYGAIVFNTVVPGFSTGAIASSTAVYAESTTAPWTLTPINTPHLPIGKIGSVYYSGILQDGGDMYYSTDLVNWTSAGHPTNYQDTQSFVTYLNDGTDLVVVFDWNNGSNVYTFYASRFNGSGWDADVSILAAQNTPFFVATVVDTGAYAFQSDFGFTRIYMSEDSGATWGFDTDITFSQSYTSGIVFDGTTWWLFNNLSGNVDSAPDYTGGLFAHSPDTDNITPDVYVPSRITLNRIGVVNNIAYGAGFLTDEPSNVYLTNEGGVMAMPAYALLSDATEHAFVHDPFVAPKFAVDPAYNSYDLTQVKFIDGYYYADCGFGGGDVVRSTTFTGSDTWLPAVSGSLSLEGTPLYAIKGDQVHAVVAVGDSGTIISSTNSGNSWALRATPPGVVGALWSVVFGNSTFVIAGSDLTNSILLSSSNGISWSDNTLLGDGGLYSVAFGSGKFVAVGSSWNYSTNGISWTPVASAGLWWAVTYLNDRFIGVSEPAGGSDGPLAYSTDGITISRPLSADTTVSLRDATYGTGTYVAVGYDGTNTVAKIVYSTNGTTWNYASLSDDIQLEFVTYGNGIFVAAGKDFTNNCPAVMTSSDGISWTTTSLTTYTSNDVAGVVWDGANYLLSLYEPASPADINTTVLTSTNGISWSLDTTTVDSPMWGGIYASAGLTCGVGQAGTVIVRSNSL